MAQVSRGGGGAAGGRTSQMRIPKGGFKRAGSPVAKRLITSIDGLEKQGKDHFGFTAPGPIGVISLDIGIDGVIQKFQDKKEIWVADYRVGVGLTGSLKKPTLEDMQAVSDVCAKVWAGIVKDYLDIMDGGARSVIIDTGSELWEILRMARFGKLTQVMPHHYGPVNAEFREFIRAAYDRTRENGYPEDVNLIMLHKLKDEWRDGADGKGHRTGEYKRAGMSDAGFLVQVNAVAWRDPTELAVPNCFHLTVTDCRQNPDMAGTDLSGDLCTFPNLAGLVLDCNPEEFL